MSEQSCCKATQPVYKQVSFSMTDRGHGCRSENTQLSVVGSGFCFYLVSFNMFSEAFTLLNNQSSGIEEFQEIK